MIKELYKNACKKLGRNKAKKYLKKVARNKEKLGQKVAGN